MVSIHHCFAEVLEVLSPYKLRTVPYCATVDTSLFHYGSYTCGNRIFHTMIISTQCTERTVPSTVVVTHSVVVCQSWYERGYGDTLVVVPAWRGGVFVEPKYSLGIFLACLKQLAISLHHTVWREMMRPDVAAEADSEQAAIIVWHFH